MVLPQIFVSHSTQDHEWCRAFVTALGTEGFDVWYDEHGLTGGTAWVSTLQCEVQSRPVFVPILTPTAWSSPWVQEEIQLAIATQRTILPVMLQPTQLAGFLLTRQWVNATSKDAATVAAEVARLLQTSAAPPAAVSRQVRPAPQVVPPSLQRLGFEGQAINDVEVLLPPLCDVPAGPFWMGTDPAREPEMAENESPFQQVYVSAFQIARFQMTVAEYACAVRASSAAPPREWTSQQKHLDHPVVYVSWRDAWAYAAWLSQVTGMPWRLPTAEEWEKAARGTDGRPYPWGGAWDASRANTEEGGPGKTTPVGVYPLGASPYGVLDMAGNVWEWAGQSPDAAQPQFSDARQSGGYMYGGAWDEAPRLSRVAYRREVLMGSPYDDAGFRLVRQAASALPGASVR